MGAADIKYVRLLIKDYKKVIRNLQIGIGNGSENIFRVPILTVQQLLTGQPDLNIIYFDPDDSSYVDATVVALDYETGDVQVSPIPTMGQVVIAYFSWVTFTDVEIQMILNRVDVVNCPYTCAAILLQAIISDTSRFVSFSQGDARYNFDELTKRLERQVDRYLKMSGITGDSIAVPFVPDVLSRIDYIPVPLIHFATPYAKL